MEASTDYFINVIQCNRILYDKSSKDFKNVVKKDEAWARIARVTNMTVEGAKKRYTSLRQKYCREKQKDELNRRFKRSGGAPWIYSERLRFLDEFIKARATYTNDADFVDVRYPDFENTGEVPLNGSGDNDIPPDDSNQEGSSSDTALQSDVQIISYQPEDVQRNTSFQLIDNFETATAFFSEYTGEFTQFHPPLESDTNVRESSEDCGTSNTMKSSSHQEPLFDIGNQSVEPDGSSHSEESPSQREPLSGSANQSIKPGVNSCASRPPIQEEPLLGSDSRKRKGTTQQHQTKFVSTAAREIPRTKLVQPSIESSCATTSSTATMSSMNVALTTARQVPRNTQPSNRLSRPLAPTATTSSATSSSAASSSAASSSAASSSAAMDNIRHKMDSCLTAIATKVAEKPQRSPHAPFLAYLGTKLPNVPKEQMADLEKEILNLVESFCQ